MFQYTTPRRVLKLEHKKSVKDAEPSASDKLTFRKTSRTFSSYGKIFTPKQMRESRSMTVSEPSYHLRKKVQYFKNSATGYQKSGYSKFFWKDSLAFCERNLSQQCRVSNTSAIRATSKICVVGSPNVGKTSLIQRLINAGDISEIKRYEDLEVSKNVIVQLDDEKLNLEFQETDMRMQRYIPRDCDAYILVYSFADRRSLSHVAQIIRQLRNKYRVNKPVFLIANKLDLGNLHIPREDGKILARLHNCKYIEISLLCQPNIDMLLLDIAKQRHVTLIDKRQKRMESEYNEARLSEYRRRIDRGGDNSEKGAWETTKGVGKGERATLNGPG
uniref:GTP-binding protein RAD n=1 Tax=Magallana gigas TaxID=29159 RepID=K1QR24_MAGGI